MAGKRTTAAPDPIGRVGQRRQVVIPRALFEKHTPAQRRIIDAQLAVGLADIKAGRVSRTFETHEEFIADLHKSAKRLMERV